MKVWKVSYTHLTDRLARRPFYKRTANVAADTRLEAINKVKAFFGPPTYGEYRASPTDQPACLFFR